MEKLDEALALMRRALDLVDECDDPHAAGPHLDLAIVRLENAGNAAVRGNEPGPTSRGAPN